MQTEQKTIFISLIDGQEKELHELSKALKGVIPVNYSVIMTIKPVQAVDPVELVNQLRHIYLMDETDAHYDYKSRDERVLHSLKALQVAMEGVMTRLSTIEKNMQNMNGSPYPQTMYTDAGESVIRGALEDLKKYLPDEGQKW